MEDPPRGPLGPTLEQLHGIYKLSDATSRAEELADIYAEALKILRDVLGADRAAVLLRDADGVMRFKAHSGLSAEYRLAAEGHSPWDADTRDPAPVLVPDVAADAGLGALRQVVLDEGIAALGFIPLLNHGRLLGKLMIYYRRPHAFDDEQVGLAQIIAAHIAFAIDRKQAEAALREAKERLRTVVSSSPVVLYATDAHGVFNFVEGRGLAELGIRPADLLGRSVWDLYPEVPREGLPRALAGESIVTQTAVAGRVFENRYGPLRDDAGRIVGMTGVATDITDRRRAEEELAFLAEAGQQLAASLDYPTTVATVAALFAPRLCDWCALYTAEGSRLHLALTYHPDPALREATAELMAYVPEGLYGGHPARAPFAEGQPGVRNDLSDDELRRLCYDERHCALVRRLGARSVLALPLFCRGRTQGTVLLNLSGRGPRATFSPGHVRRAEELARRAAMAIDNARLFQESQEAVRAREEFLSIASHEVRSPLNTLHMQMQLLLRTAQKGQLHSIAPERLLNMLESGERQVRRLSEMIGKLFDFTRVTAGALDLHLEDVDLHQTVRDVLARFEGELEHAGCAVEVAPPPEAGPCLGRWDRLRLEQVVTNLVANAMKFGAGKPIEVRMEHDARVARLAVRDHGIGIAPEQQERLFRRFERPAGRRFAGLGLGLYIVNKLVQALHGSITVSSQLGAGATFTVELPRGEVGATLSV